MTLLLEESRLTSMVPRRTRMVMKPQRMAILMLLKVFWILWLWGSMLSLFCVFKVDKRALVLCLWWFFCHMEVEIEWKLNIRVWFNMDFFFKQLVDMGS